MPTTAPKLPHKYANHNGMKKLLSQYSKRADEFLHIFTIETGTSDFLRSQPTSYLYADTNATYFC